MDQENNMFSEKQDKLYTMTNPHSYNTFFGYKDS